MARIKLMWVEADEQPLTWEQKDAMRLGSEVRRAGDKIEGLTVPPGKMWLFPTGNGYERIEAVVKGQRRQAMVNE